MLNALCISDLQCPFEHKHAFDFACHVEKTFFPEVKPRVFNLGDEVDQHTLSKWGSNPNGMSAKAEFEEAKLRLKPWMERWPTMRICISNHTYRYMKKAYAAGIPDGFMKTVGEAYDAPKGWLWADRWIADKVLFEHGEMVSGPLAAIRAAHQNRMNTVIGHQHTNGGVIFNSSAWDTIWAMNTGCLIDINQYAFDYGRILRNKPTLGMGVIVEGTPCFVPMWLDKDGNWLGRI